MNLHPTANTFRQEFIAFLIESGALTFGNFVTKAGRSSPYFLNTGAFNEGRTLAKLAQFYAEALLTSEITFDMLFGPAYKGITLASATAVALAMPPTKTNSPARNVLFAYNRKEIKDHGEGGRLIGAPLIGRIIIIDDVISTGTSIKESITTIQAAGATPCGVLIALDRMEKYGNEKNLSQYSAAQEITHMFGTPVISIGNLDDLATYLKRKKHTDHQKAVEDYRRRYGAIASYAEEALGDCLSTSST